MAVTVRSITDPADAWSWNSEPAVRRLMVEFGDGLDWRFVMGGLAREYANGERPKLMEQWLEAADRGGMPIDPRIWTEGPLESSYPACMAVKAAAEQAPDGG